MSLIDALPGNKGGEDGGSGTARAGASLEHLHIGLLILKQLEEVHQVAIVCEAIHAYEDITDQKDFTRAYQYTPRYTWAH
jgi:hypothetical protein